MQASIGQVSLRPRATTYKGTPMRSRLEARFAAFLDDHGDAWIYEPRAYAGDGGQYLPDFEIVWTARPDCKLFVEVKPTVEAALRVLPRMQVVWESEPTAALLIVVASGPWFVALSRLAPKWVVLQNDSWAAW